MNHYHKELKMYADSGLRTTSEWSDLGREIKPDSTCRATVDHRGDQLPLFSRDQTRVRAAGANKNPATAASTPA